MPKINNIQLVSLRKYRDYLNNAGKLMPSIAKTLQGKVNETKKFRFILGILMGTELIKAETRGLVILNEYIGELNSIYAKKGSHNVKPMNDYNRQSYGQIAAIFYREYELSKNDPRLLRQMQNLNEKRNEIAHDIIFKFQGDLDRADQEIRPYVTSQVIHEVLNKLIEMFNEKRKENALIEKKIKSAGLF